MVLLGALPGIVFVQSYLTGRFPRRIARVSPLAELALYVGFAIPIDLFGLSRLDQHPFRLEIVVRALSNSLGDQHVSSLVNQLRASWHDLLIEYGVALTLAFVAGLSTRRLVWAFRLDIYLPALRMKHRLYYELLGRLEGLPRQLIPYADVLAECPGDGSRLYRGILASFDFDQDGELSLLTLTNPQRGHLRGDEFEWKPIPSDRLLLLARNVHSINLQYFSIDPPDLNFERLRWWIKTWFRRIAFEEP